MERALHRILLVLPVILAGSSAARAHSFEWTDVQVRLLAGSFHIQVVCDLDALALGVSPEVDSRELAGILRRLSEREFEEVESRLRNLIERRIRIRFDGEAASFELHFPDNPEPRSQAGVDSVFGTRLHLVGPIPEGSREMSFFASRAFPPVRLNVTDPAGRPFPSLLLQRGERSPPLSVRGEPGLPSIPRIVARYLKLGFTHILPLGLDHILFVLGLFLFRIGLKGLLLQVSVFTVAHTLTLGLGIYGVVSLPGRPVEALIALSIVYVAVENITSSKVGRTRLLAIFGFGLLHGLGFAGVAAQLGLPVTRKAVALFSFNLGVELGQIAVLAGAFLVLGPFRKSPGGFARISLVGSILIGAIGTWLLWNRLGTG